MSNEEVAEFVDTYRLMCSKNGEKYVVEANVQNSHIARLLCEEARIRWIMRGKKSSLYDDISCIIIEFDEVALYHTRAESNSKFSDVLEVLSC